jgi:hypothetical protein
LERDGYTVGLAGRSILVARCPATSLRAIAPDGFDARINASLQWGACPRKRDAVRRPPASSALPGQPGTLLKTLAARPRIARPTTGRTVPADRKIIRVELLSLYLENWKVPASVGGRAGDKIKAPGFPAFDPATGEAASVPADRETELVTGQLKPCLEPLACLWTKY